MRRGLPFGDPAREFTKEIGSQMVDESKKAALNGVGMPEHLVEGYFMSKDAREMGEGKFGLGCRIWANLVWTFGLAAVSIYSLIKGF
jgi:hypothetical protein